MRFLHVGVDDVFELLQGLPHDVDVLDVQEDQLRVLVLVALVASSRGLGEGGGGAARLFIVYLFHR